MPAPNAKTLALMASRANGELGWLAQIQTALKRSVSIGGAATLLQVGEATLHNLLKKPLGEALGPCDRGQAAELLGVTRGHLDAWSQDPTVTLKMAMGVALPSKAGRPKRDKTHTPPPK